MKKSNIFIALAVTIILAASSIGVVFAAQATSSTASTTAGAINFTASSGIRWNEGMQVFEVFNYTGVSIMGQGKQYVNATGDIRTLALGAETGYKLADYTENYNIMKDIPYDENATVHNEFSTSVPDFGTEGNTAGIIDGRGFTFKNFPVRVGFGLYRNFYGTLRNLNIDFGNDVVSDNFYGMFHINAGTIENCTVLGGGASSFVNSYYFPFGYYNQTIGEMINCTNYFTANLTGSTSLVAGIVCYNLGLIEGCTNQANLSAAFLAGIVYRVYSNSNFTTAKILNCTNNGNITAYSLATDIFYNVAAGIATAVTPDQDYTVRGCVNNGTITAENETYGVACGILAAFANDSPDTWLQNMTNSYNNTNNGTIICGRLGYAFPLYYGRTGATRD